MNPLVVKDEELLFANCTELNASLAGSMAKFRPVMLVAAGAESITQADESLPLSENVTLLAIEAFVGAVSPM